MAITKLSTQSSNCPNQEYGIHVARLANSPADVIFPCLLARNYKITFPLYTKGGNHLQIISNTVQKIWVEKRKYSTLLHSQMNFNWRTRLRPCTQTLYSALIWNGQSIIDSFINMISTRGISSMKYWDSSSRRKRYVGKVKQQCYWKVIPMTYFPQWDTSEVCLKVKGSHLLMCLETRLMPIKVISCVWKQIKGIV